jgi:hypothetical protein
MYLSQLGFPFNPQKQSARESPNNILMETLLDAEVRTAERQNSMKKLLIFFIRATTWLQSL